MVNGHIGLATQNHADKTNEINPLWKFAWVWVLLVIVVAIFW